MEQRISKIKLEFLCPIQSFKLANKQYTRKLNLTQRLACLHKPWLDMSLIKFDLHLWPDDSFLFTAQYVLPQVPVNNQAHLNNRKEQYIGTTRTWGRIYYQLSNILLLSSSRYCRYRYIWRRANRARKTNKVLVTVLVCCAFTIFCSSSRSLCCLLFILL